jgi:outer membrane protein TolC
LGKLLPRHFLPRQQEDRIVEMMTEKSMAAEIADGHLSKLIAVSLAVLIAGCANMSGLSPQSSPTDANRLEASQSLADTPVSAAAWPGDDWWIAYADPQLDQLIAEALVGSPTLKVAEARTRKAIAFADTTKSSLYPQVNADFEATRQRFPENGLTPPPFAGGWGTLNQLQATLNWELDFWGKNRSA